jgi:hypothetical protein
LSLVFPRPYGTWKFDSARKLALEVKKHGVRLNELALHFRLYNCFIKSGASENQVESFIANVGTAKVPPEKIIELVNELFNISKAESILQLSAKEHRFSAGKIVAKLRNIKRLENKENRLKKSCEILSMKEARYKDIIRFAEDIAALGIGIDELIAHKVGIKEASKLYNLPFVSTTIRLIEDIKKIQ